MKINANLVTFLILALFIQCSSEPEPIQEQKKPNILFIAVDDLRPELGCYGVDHIKTPNFDRLAASGMIFEKAYCQQAVCAASRNSLIHGYYAAVSMIDAQLGKLLNTLKQLELTENTIIVLWGDHGWKLGDYGNWCKHSNMELDTRVPLFFSIPWLDKGLKTASLAEFVDIYPTLCDLAGLEKPVHLEGQSLLPILENPEAKVNEVAISQYPRGKALGYDRKRELMGYSIRTEQYRYTRWQKYEHPMEVVERELYDHSTGPLAIKNLVAEEAYTQIVSEMDEIMDKELGKYKLLKVKTISDH